MEETLIINLTVKDWMINFAILWMILSTFNSIMEIVKFFMKRKINRLKMQKHSTTMEVIDSQIQDVADMKGKLK